jgi:hypothetical protein
LTSPFVRGYYHSRFSVAITRRGSIRVQNLPLFRFQAGVREPGRSRVSPKHRAPEKNPAMKKPFALLLLISLVVSVGLAVAQEPPAQQLKFIHELRQKGLADLALEYIEKIQKNAPPELAPILPLEAAKTRVTLAKFKPPEERLTLLNKAQEELEGYLKSKKDTEEAPQLKLEIARATAYQGQAFLGQALRTDKEKEQEDFAKKARDRFVEARKKFDEALKDMADLLGKYKNPDPNLEEVFKKRLASDLLDGKLDRAKTFLFEGRAYLNTDDTNDRKKQAETYEAGLNALKELAADKSGANEEARWLTLAWYIDVASRAGKGDEAEKIYKKLYTAYEDAKKDLGKLMADPKISKKILDEKRAELANMVPAMRLAAYVYIQAVRDGHFKLPAGTTSKAKFLEDASTGWLKEFKAYQKTPEGYGIQLELAYAYLDQALKISKSYNDPKAKPLYDKAQAQFAVVAASHSDLAAEAKTQSVIIEVARIGTAATVEGLKDFKECDLKARFELKQMADTGKAIKKLLDDAPPDKDKKLEALKKKQKEHLKTIIAAFNRALELATPLTAQNKIDEVRYFLAYTYLISGDPYRAAILADYLARRDPPGKEAPLAANYALQAYEQVLKKYNEPANQKQLFDLAQFVVNERSVQWKDQPVTDIAQYSLALYYMRDKNFVKSIEHLEKLHKDFRAYTFAQCQLALLALNLAAEAANNKDLDPQKAQEKVLAYRTKALQALRNIPTLAKNADPATAAMFFTAQLNQGTILYNDSLMFLKEGNDKVAEAKLKEMVTFTKDLLKQFNEAVQ